jgi:hypothetical protein
MLQALEDSCLGPCTCPCCRFNFRIIRVESWVVITLSLHCGLTSGSLLGVLVSRTWQGNEPFIFRRGKVFLGGMLIALLLKTQIRKGRSTARLNTAFRPILSSNHSVLAVLAGHCTVWRWVWNFPNSDSCISDQRKSFKSTTVGYYSRFFYITNILSHLIAGP